MAANQDKQTNSEEKLGSIEEGQQVESSAEGHSGSGAEGGFFETNTGAGGSDANIGAGREVEGGSFEQDVIRPKNSEALGGLGSGRGSTPDTGTHDIGSGSHGGSGASSGPASGIGARRTGDNGNTGGSDGADMEEGNDHGSTGDIGGETGADMGTGSGGATGETIGTP
jgi:hypothetical protein